MKLRATLAIAVVVVIATAIPGFAQDKVKSDTLKWAEKSFKYVGEKSCKTCHKFEYDSWMTTKHANAWVALKPEEQKKPECASCHSTGKTAADSLIVNVTCESCHGPGSAYKSMKAMGDHGLAVTSGLLPVTEKTCLQCHNKNSPTFKGFKFADAVMNGVHKIKPKTPAK